MDSINITTCGEHRYCKLGSGKTDIVIELGICTSLSEWHSTAQKLSESRNVLVYERSRNTDTERSPENIAKELYALLNNIGCAEKIILIAHSQGGLYAAQFALMYPEKIKGLILLDPLSPDDNKYKNILTPVEQKKSGFDKSANLVLMQKLARMHLGFIIKAIMKKAPPFYYYNKFSDEERYDILSSLTKPAIHASAIAEYRSSHDEKNLTDLKSKEGFPQIPLVLITHTSEFSVKEIMEFGQTDRDFAEKVEELWQSLMKVYLSFSDKSAYIQAENSGHYMHLTEPELIYKALSVIEK